MKNQDFVAIAAKARAKKDELLARISKMKADYSEGGYDEHFGYYPSSYHFNILEYFSEAELEEFLTKEYQDVALALYDKAMQEADKTDSGCYTFCSCFARPMIDILPEAELKRRIERYFTSRGKYDLKDFAEAIVEKGDHDLIMYMIDKSFKSGLYDDVQRMIFARNNEEEVFYLLSQQKLAQNDTYLCQELADFQIGILKQNSASKHCKLVSYCKLMNAAQVEMYELGLDYLYSIHLKTYGVCQELQMIALKKDDKKMLYEIIEEHCLAPFGASVYFVEHVDDEVFFRYGYQFDIDAELALLKQNNSARIFWYIARYKLRPACVSYLLDNNMKEYIAKLSEDYAFFEDNLRKYSEMYSPEDMLNNLKKMPYNNEKDVDFTFRCLIPYPELLVQAFEVKRCSNELAESLFEQGNFAVKKAVVMTHYSEKYAGFIFENSDMELLELWYNRQYKHKPSLPEGIAFGHFNKDAARFLVDNCLFTAEQENNFLTQRDEEDATYYMSVFYPFC